MAIKVIGYSERGMISAICADIARSREPFPMVASLAKLIEFPRRNGGPSQIDKIVHSEILIEQSFSTFGTPDLVLLIRTANGARHAILIEAKVHTDKRLGMETSQRWAFFQNALRSTRRRPSGLFTQMYRSHRLIERLRDGKDNFTKKKFFGGTKLGKNRVVTRAVEKVGEYVRDGGFGWVVALLPEHSTTVRAFFESELRDFRPDPDQLPGWDTENWGFVTWEQIEALCESTPDDWLHTLTAFEWNHEQIYMGRRERDRTLNDGNIGFRSED